MSTLTVANVETANSVTDLTIVTGNTSGPQLVITSGNRILFNSTIDATLVSSNATAVNTTAYSTANLIVTKQLRLTANVTPANLATNNTIDWAAGVAGDYQIRFQANSTNATILQYHVYGLTGGVNGQIVTLTNIGPTKVTLRTEESGNSTFNQANSVNRFQLPNHVSLDGYQSIELYYDGVSQRWRGVDTQGIAVSHKQALTKGFFMGGQTPTGPFSVESVNGIDITTYSAETTAASTTSLSASRSRAAAAGNADKGFFAGGYVEPTNVSTADRTTYSTETTAAVSGANLSQARYDLSGAGNSDKGFFAAGFNVAANAAVTTSNRTRYSTETSAAVSGSNLTQAVMNPAAAGNEEKCFFAGGFSITSNSDVSTSNRIFFSTETSAAVSGSNLSQPRNGLAAAGSADKGFYAGGRANRSPTDAGTITTTAGRTTYSTEVHAAVTGANLSQARQYLSAL